MLLEECHFLMSPPVRLLVGRSVFGRSVGRSAGLTHLQIAFPIILELEGVEGEEVEEEVAVEEVVCWTSLLVLLIPAQF